MVNRPASDPNAEKNARRTVIIEPENLKISVITAVYNRQETIERAINSFCAQDYENKEQIVIEGKSSDSTLDIAQAAKCSTTSIFSEPDSGIYDALNKGIKRATGDIVGLLHSDDYFADNSVLSQVAAEFTKADIDVVFADASFFDASQPERTTRRYDSSKFNPDTIRNGWMPAHTTMFVRKEIFDRFGAYRTDYTIAADFEFVARVFSSKKVKWHYVPDIWVKMQSGGISTSGWKSRVILNQEVIRACRENGIRTSYARVLSKYPRKVLELVQNRT